MKVQCLACWLAVCAITSTIDAAPFLEGRVTDEYGRPLEGASVKIWDCIGTCFGGKTVLTDVEGHYVFETKPYRNSPLLSVSMPGRYEVSREERGPELYEDEADTETPRQVDFVLGTPAAATVNLEGEAPDGWSQSLLIRPQPGSEVRRYDVHSGTGTYGSRYSFDLLPRNENLHLVVVREKIVIETDDPEATEEERRAARRNRVEIVSPPIGLIDPQLYSIRAKVEHDAASDTPYIIIESVTDAVGTDRTAVLALPDPQFGPPVDAATREQALALLERVAETAKPWNARPPADIASYEYDVVASEQEPTHVTITQESPVGPGWNDIARQRGVAYMPPLRWLFSQPENVVFVGVDMSADRAVLHYRLKEGRGFGAGLGVGSNWNGFFTTGFSLGRLIIDPETATVLEHRLYNGPLGDEAVETFSDYEAVGEGYAPRSLRIQSNGMDFQLSFRIHADRLWLLEEASHGDLPSYRVENVVVHLTD